MSVNDHARWLPWRGRSPVRWTLALGLCVVALVAALQPVGMPAPAIHPLATSAALLALAVAITAVWSEGGPIAGAWPWRGPNPVRNTLAFVLGYLALALVLLDPVLSELIERWARTWLVFAVATTLMFASSVASAEGGRSLRWVKRLFWACFTVIVWWLVQERQGR